MAIQSIPKTVQKQAIGTNSSSSSQDNDEENQHGRESRSVSTNAASASSTEFRICILNTLSYVILMVAILTNSVNNLLSLAEKEHYAYWESTLVFTLIQFITAYATISFIIAAACCLTKDPTKESGASSLVGSLMTTLTSVFLLICFIFVVMGIGKQKIQPLSWNASNNIKELDRSIITQESYTYELKLVAYSSASDSEDFYDILATMNNRILSLEATKEFLNKFDCDNNLFPTLAIQHISLFGSMGSFDSYPVSNLDCGPV